MLSNLANESCTLFVFVYRIMLDMFICLIYIYREFFYVVCTIFIKCLNKYIEFGNIQIL